MFQRRIAANESLIRLSQTWDSYSEINTKKLVTENDFPFFGKLDLHRNYKVLDIGCGAGNYLALMVAYCDTVYGIDISMEMLSQAKKKHLTVNRADCRRLPFHDDSFDIAYSFIVFNYVKDWQKAVAELARVLKPGGLGIVVSANTWSVLAPLRKILHLLGLYKYGATYHASASALCREGNEHRLSYCESKILDKATSGKSSRLYKMLNRFDRIVGSIIPYWGGEVAVFFQKFSVSP